MKIKLRRPTIYLSHPIRGSTGNDFNKGNCEKAAAAARRLRRVFPEADFYCPAEHNLTLQLLTKDNKVTIEDVICADLQVLAACHGWMYYAFGVSKGSEIEWHEAEKLGLTPMNTTDNWFPYDIEKTCYQILRKDFGPLVEATVKRFRHGTRNTRAIQKII